MNNNKYSNPRNLIGDIPLYNEFNEFNYYGNPNNVVATFNNGDEFLRPYPNNNSPLQSPPPSFLIPTPTSAAVASAAAPAARHYAPWQISQMVNNNARRARLAKMAGPRATYREPVHGRTVQQQSNIQTEGLANPLNRVRRTIANEPSYLPNIRRNMTRRTTKRPSPLGLGNRRRGRGRSRARGRSQRNYRKN
jgi:hypothetical protein